MDKEYYMGLAIEQAKIAYENDEVPIGAVIVFNDEVIAYGRNRRMEMKNPLYHAEIIAINDAAKFINDWRLEDCHLFVTVEPCQMCAGAIVQSRIKSITFGAHNKKSGSISSVINILDNDEFNHKVEVTSGIMEEESKELMQNFFKKFRNCKKI